MSHRPPRFLSKVIVRNLPVNLDEAAFRELAGDISLRATDYFYYVPGKIRSKSSDVLSRAYLNFTNQSALLSFKDKLDGHTFLDSKGASLSCSVEYAQSQLKPRKIGGGGSKQHAKADTLSGTIEDDEHYKQFLAELAAPTALATGDDDVNGTNNGKQLTPLLMAIKQKDQQKFAEKMKAKKKKPKKTAFIAKPAAAPSPSKRKRQKKKKPQPTGPQFGAVKILGTPAPASPTPSAPTAAPSTPTAAAKQPRPRKPKPKKTGGAPPKSSAKKPQKAS